MVKIIRHTNSNEGDIKRRNCIIEQLYIKSIPILLGILAKEGFYRNCIEERQEVTQAFFADKMCNKSPEELQPFIDKWPGWVMTSFRNYIFDQMRRKKVQSKRGEKHLNHLGKDAAISKDDYDESSETRQRLRSIVQKHHSEKYVKIFDLMADEYENKEIAIKLNENVNTIVVAAHRIRTTLRKSLY